MDGLKGLMGDSRCVMAVKICETVFVGGVLSRWI